MAEKKNADSAKGKQGQMRNAIPVAASCVVALAALAVFAQALDVPAGCSLTAPATFSVLFATEAGNFTVDVKRSNAPIGADRFYSLVKCKYFDDNGFFRVVPGFVVQWGINGTPSVSAAWENANINDDPVILSNVFGTMAYADAGPDTRTTQIFVNLGDNSGLDAQGFAPFGTISSTDMGVFSKIYAGYGQDPDQDLIYSQGNKYLQANFPKLTYSSTVTIVA